MDKKVYLRRKEIMNHLPKEVRAEAVLKLSSVYVNRQPLNPFTRADEKKYLDGILDVAPEHPDWPRHSKTFWADLTIPVGFTGVELDISTDKEGNPRSIMDYIKYHFAIKHPHVGLTKEEMSKTSQKRFYIHDESRDVKNRNSEIQRKKDADKEFIKLSSDPKSMKRVLRILSDANPDRLTEDQIENALYDLKSKSPVKFVKIATDKNLTFKAEIEELVSAGVLRKIGNQVIFIDEVIGDTVEDAVVYLKDKKNSGQLTIMRAKLKELAL
tara:strand:- start:75 stop:884 length:810 start_codon:yes stop_codon:yes gene_type:complete